VLGSIEHEDRVGAHPHHAGPTGACWDEVPVVLLRQDHWIAVGCVDELRSGLQMTIDEMFECHPILL
jgi:hypothetical protein